MNDKVYFFVLVMMYTFCLQSMPEESRKKRVSFSSSEDVQEYELTERERLEKKIHIMEIEILNKQAYINTYQKKLEKAHAQKFNLEQELRAKRERLKEINQTERAVKGHDVEEPPTRLRKKRARREPVEPFRNGTPYSNQHQRGRD